MAGKSYSGGNVLVGTKLSLDGLGKGLSDAATKLRGWANSVGKVILPAIGASIGAGLAAGFGLEKLREASAATIDATAKLADRIGTSTEGLVGLQHAAKLAGVDSDSLGGALTKLGVNLAKAQQEGKGTEGVFALLGVSAGELAKMDRGEAFKVIADRLQRIPNPAQQAAAAVELFGKQGASLGNLLMQGSEGIAAAQAEAEKMGITSSRLDSAKVEASNDSWTKVGEAIGGVGNVLAITLAPLLKAVGDGLTELVARVNDWVRGTADGGGAVTGVLGLVSRAVGFLGDAWDALQLAFVAVQASITSGLAAIVSGIGSAAHALENLANMIPGVKVEFTSFIDTFAEDLDRLAGTQWDEFNKKLAAPPSSRGVEQFFEDLQRKTEEAGNVQAKLRTDWTGLADVVDTTNAKAEKQHREQRNLAFAGALDVGSREAREVMLRGRLGTSSEKGIDAVGKNTGMIAKTSERTNQLLEQVVAFFNGGSTEEGIW